MLGMLVKKIEYCPFKFWKELWCDFDGDYIESVDCFARTSNTILKTYGESGQPCLVPDFRGMFLLSLISPRPLS
ncbi:hypothetical protein H671_5g14514 [Cricetulus griseus]|nr:hypothetical protein H671_5g14514 [Cricetulus griseus]